MANPGYVRSTDGSDADDGSTWALANATMSGAITDSAAGDTIYVSQSHAQTQATALTLTFVGTLASRNKIIFGDDAAEPPTALATTGSISTTGTSGITIAGSLHWTGGTISCGTGAGNVSLTVASADNNYQSYAGTTFVIGTTSTAARFVCGSNTSTVETRVDFRDCIWKFGSTSQGWSLYRTVRVFGGSIDNSGSKPATLIVVAPTISLDCVIENFDASNCATSFNWCAASPVAPGRILLRNCKAPSGWTGDLVSSSISHPCFRVEAYNMDTGASNYKFWIRDYFGSVIQETTIVRSGGASDGDTAMSAKMVSNSNAGFPGGGLVSQPIAMRLDSSGSSVTATVELVTDNVTLTNKDLSIRVLYLKNSGDTLGGSATSEPSVVASATNLTSSSVTWTTTGLTTPVKQKATVSFTPQQEGVAVIEVTLYKASTTVYVDIQPTVA